MKIQMKTTYLDYENQKVFWNNVHVWGQFDTIHQEAPREPCILPSPFPFFKDVGLYHPKSPIPNLVTQILS